MPQRAMQLLQVTFPRPVAAFLAETTRWRRSMSMFSPRRKRANGSPAASTSSLGPVATKRGANCCAPTQIHRPPLTIFVSELATPTDAIQSAAIAQRLLLTLESQGSKLAHGFTPTDATGTVTAAVDRGPQPLCALTRAILAPKVS